MVKQLLYARKALIDARNNSYQRRQHFLDHIQCQSIDAGKTSQANITQQIKKAEQKRFCWNTFKLLRIGPQSSVGFTHILLPDGNNPNKYTQIQTKSLLDSFLLQRNIDHFQQASGTPFTTPDLIAYTGEDGCHENTTDILIGTVRNDLPKYVKLLLQQFKSSNKTIDITFSFHDMCNGFMKWVNT
jgi:hypothetical protein